MVFLPDTLFLERIPKRHKDKGIVPEFTLQEYDVEKDGVKYKSLYRQFMQCVDEYDAAETILGSQSNWNKLKNCKWFYEGWKGCSVHRGYEAWLEDMKARDYSIAKKALMLAVSEGDTGAAKKLADLTKPKGEETKGRPRKSDIKQAAVKIAQDKEAFEEDLKRLNVIPIRG